jgi:hypothetical protein
MVYHVNDKGVTALEPTSFDVLDLRRSKVGDIDW